MLARDQHHLITTGGEGQFNWKHPKHYWYNGAWESDYNYNGQGVRWLYLVYNCLLRSQLAKTLTKTLTSGISILAHM